MTNASSDHADGYRDFSEGMIALIFEDLPKGKAEAQDSAEQAAIAAMSDYLLNQTGAGYLSAMRTFANLHDESCSSLGSLIHRVVAETGYWPSVSADDGLREDAITNQLAFMRKNMRDLTIGR